MLVSQSGERNVRECPEHDPRARYSCLWVLTNNVQKRKEEREEKGGFSDFIITASFLVQFRQNKL
jgi:hypothetical protein